METVEEYTVIRSKETINGDDVYFTYSQKQGQTPLSVEFSLDAVRGVNITGYYTLSGQLNISTVGVGFSMTPIIGQIIDLCKNIMVPPTN